MAFTNTHSNPAYITALMGAVGVLGGDFFQIMVAADDSWMKSRTIVDAWKRMRPGGGLSSQHGIALDLFGRPQRGLGGRRSQLDD